MILHVPAFLVDHNSVSFLTCPPVGTVIVVVESVPIRLIILLAVFFSIAVGGVVEGVCKMSCTVRSYTEGVAMSVWHLFSRCLR